MNEDGKRLSVGKLLTDVRDRLLYKELKHASMEEYAWVRLELKRASLFRYLKVYAWVSKFHPEWLLPKPKGFIPDFGDTDDLIWIDEAISHMDAAVEIIQAAISNRKGE
jgi:hypothetical protein